MKIPRAILVKVMITPRVKAGDKTTKNDLTQKTPNSITIQFQRLTVHRSLGEVVEVQYFTRYVPHDRL
jgi:hypothetical protein